MSKKKKKLIQKYKRHYMTIKTYLFPMTIEQLSEYCKNNEDNIYLELQGKKDLICCRAIETDEGRFIFYIDEERIIEEKVEYNTTYRCWDYAYTQDYIVQPWGSFKINDLFWKGTHDDRPVKPKIEKIIVRGK